VIIDCPDPDQVVIDSGQTNNFVFSIARKNWPVIFASGSGPVTLDSGQSLDLAPGSYGSLLLNSGAKLTLNTGKYYFTSMMLNSGSELRLNKATGPIQMFVSGNGTCRATMIDVAGEVGDLLLAVLGTNEVHVGEPFYGTLFVPNAKLTLATVNVPYVGQFLGKSIEVHQDNRVIAKPIDWRRISSPESCGGVQILEGDL
jgi:hypothetical protein